jgi:outer membrane cobalamin receptor
MVKFARTLLTGTALALFSGFAGAQRPLSDPVAFTIDSSLLPDALNAWAQQAGLQLFWPSDERASHFKAPRLAGTFTPESALQRLLQGSGLTYSFVDARTVAIKRVAAQDNFAKNGSSAPAALGERLLRRAGRKSGSSVDPPQPEVKEIVVTGSHIRGGNLSSPVFTVDRIDMELTGVSSLPQLVQSLPQNFNNISDTTFGTINGGADGSLGNGFALNLRGLGSAATLVLLNGRRLVPSGDGSFVDVSLIPWNALERVDLLTDGASAIYGSDAIGGVVNVILRSRFDGAETQARYGTVTRGDSAEYRLGQTFGDTWEGGSALLSYEYFRRTPLDSTDRDFTRDAPGTLDLSPRQERHGAVATFSRQMSPRLELFGDVFFGRRHSDQRYTVLGPHSRQSATLDQLNGAFGANIELEGGWQLRPGGMYGRSDTRQQSFTDGRSSSLFDFTSGAWAAEVAADGPIARLDAGDVRLAAGAQFRNERFDPTALTGIEATQPLHRDVGVGYAEVLVPLIGDRNRRRGIERLELTAAARFEHYSDFGSTTNPKFGASWSPAAGINLRGTYGTSFKAPLLSQINPANLIPVAFDLPDPQAAEGVTPAIVLFGSATDLGPEEAAAWTAGVDLATDVLPGFAASLTYFNIRFDDRVAMPIPDDGRILTVLGDPRYAPFIDDAPDGATLDAWFAHPNFINDSSAAAAAQIGAVVDDRLVNLVEQTLSGIDTLLSYRDISGAGEFAIQLAGNYLFAGRRRVLRASAATSTLNSVFNPVDLKLRSSLEWTRGAVAATVAVNYTDGYKDDRLAGIAGPGQRKQVDSWTTCDFTLGYQAGGSDAGPWWQDANLNLTVTNIFDRDPPFIASPFRLHFDGANANPMGRSVGVMLRKRW